MNAPRPPRAQVLTRRQADTLELLRLATAAAGESWVRPMDIGGFDGSHHSTTLAQLARMGLARRARRGGHTRNAWGYRAMFPVVDGRICRLGERVVQRHELADDATCALNLRRADRGLVMTALIADGDHVKAIDVYLSDTAAADFGQSMLELSCTSPSQPPPLTMPPAVGSPAARWRAALAKSRRV